MRRIRDQPPPDVQSLNNCSEELRNFIGGMLVKEPETRQTAVQLLEHPFLKFAGSLDVIKPLIRPLNVAELFRQPPAAVPAGQHPPPPPPPAGNS